MVVNAYFSSRQMLESKYSILLADVARQSNIRIEEYLRNIRQISLISSYGINSYISAVSQDNYPVQNYLRNQSIANEMQATQLLMNYITMKDRKISIYVYNMNPGNDLYISPNKPIDYAYEPRQEAWFNDFWNRTTLRGICRRKRTGRSKEKATGPFTICGKYWTWRTASCSA